MVGILILNYNDPKTTISCIESIVAVNTYPSKCLIVDNASKDDSVQEIGDYLQSTYGDRYEKMPQQNVLKDFSLVVAGENGGYARGNNFGLRYLENDPEIDYVLILNSDVLFTDDIIKPLVDKLESLPDAGLVSPLLYCKDRKTIDYNCARTCIGNRQLIEIFLFHYHDFGGRISRARSECKILKMHPEMLEQDLVQIELPSGSCMLIRKELFREIGWFDSNTFLYYEENILFKKLLKLGKRNYIYTKVSCIHLGAQSTSKTPVPFLKVKESESAIYYLRSYGNMTLGQKLLAAVAFKSFLLRMKLAAAYRSLKTDSNK